MSGEGRSGVAIGCPPEGRQAAISLLSTQDEAELALGEAGLGQGPQMVLGLFLLARMSPHLTFVLPHIGGDSTCGSSASQVRSGPRDETWWFPQPRHTAAVPMEDAAPSH